jgi:phosphoserine phosphatase
VSTLIATELERDASGRVTGRIRGVPSFREGKVVRIEQWLSARGVQLTDCRDSVFYSDSTNDLALLRAVSQPVATNPSPALEAIAREHGWRILRLFE